MNTPDNFTLWELRSSTTDALTRCTLEQDCNGVVLLRITHDEFDIASYRCPSRQDAISRATIIHKDLSRQGWTVVRNAE
jgi:hypothetical protein